MTEFNPSDLKTWYASLSDEARAELEALGVDVVNRSTHPAVVASRWDEAGYGRQVLGDKIDYHFGHVSPNSTLLAPIGNLWEPDCWWHLQDMMLHSSKHGYSVSIQEMQDTSILASQAIGLMRWQASIAARDAGVEWVLMIDNDALLEKDTLIRLLAHDRPVVFPLLENIGRKLPEEVDPVSFPPMLKPGQGLVPVQWAAMSVMLFNVRIFNALDSNAWWGTDSHFNQALNAIGHRTYVDTNTTVKTVRGPARTACLKYDEYWENNRKVQERLKYEERDRNPPPGFDPVFDDGIVDEHGVYFAVPNGTVNRNAGL